MMTGRMYVVADRKPRRRAAGFRGGWAVVVAQWKGRGPRNVLVRFEDGRQVVRPARGMLPFPQPEATDPMAV